jgi:hypothetical protein
MSTEKSSRSRNHKSKGRHIQGRLQMQGHRWEFLVPAAMFAIVLTAGCASTPKMPSEGATVFGKPSAVVQKAAIDSLVVAGFEIQKTEPLYVEGMRPHRVGLVVGSGGETVGVWLEPLGDSRTRVRVDTAKSLLGIAGQRNWNEDILNEMTKSLGKPE